MPSLTIKQPAITTIVISPINQLFLNDTEEILDVQWLDLEKVKNMTEQELRGYDTALKDIKNFEEKKIYPLEIFEFSSLNCKICLCKSYNF